MPVTIETTDASTPETFPLSGLKAGQVVKDRVGDIHIVVYNNNDRLTVWVGYQDGTPRFPGIYTPTPDERFTILRNTRVVFES